MKIKKMMMILSVCACCFLFAGCSAENTASANDSAGTESTMEDGLPEMEDKLPDVEPVVEDNWPDSIGKENEKMTAENLSFEIPISDPMTLTVTCVTESGKLDMEIKDDDGEKIFSKSDIQTENFEVNVNSSGTCTVIIHAENHTGSFWIQPQK